MRSRQVGIVNLVWVMLSLRCLRCQMEKKAIEHWGLELTGRVSEEIQMWEPSA